MNAGKLNDRITFQSRGTDKWQDRLTTHADMRILSGEETIEAGRTVAQLVVEFSVRNVSALEELRTSWRIRRLGHNETYNIRRIDRDTNRHRVILRCEGGK